MMGGGGAGVDEEELRRGEREWSMDEEMRVEGESSGSGGPGERGEAFLRIFACARGGDEGRGRASSEGGEAEGGG